jgi:hypothetical protein
MVFQIKIVMKDSNRVLKCEKKILILIKMNSWILKMNINMVYRQKLVNKLNSLEKELYLTLKACNYQLKGI